ncbi:hypothetical protein BM221_006844 [Beauveria bassiana]|uniref:Uncharacterized protein n=1 Tax=Beauveria bassiana TaxID=176275 RepID=A0A2N6NIT4_BEABA|nr:hypothetical protein BM221_006844 [Beauveria bassiana]
MIPFSHATSLYAAATALDLGTFFLLALVTVLQFCFVRRHRDAARTWVKWARHSLALFTFRFADRGIEFFASEKKGLWQTRGFLDSIWQLCEAVLRVFLLVTFAMLGAGLAMARSSSSSSAAGTIGGAAPAGWTRTPGLAWGAGGLTLVLAVGLFGLRCYFWAHVYDENKAHSVTARKSKSQDGVVNLATIERATIDMDFALHCIWLVLSLLVLGLAVRTRSLSRAAPHTITNSRLIKLHSLKASKYFLTCAVLFVAQPLYNIIISIMFRLGSSSVSGIEATIVTDVVFRTWPYALILVVLFVLGRRKIGGVWSTQQPFQTKDAAAGETVYQTPWGYQVTHQTAPPQAPVSMIPI